MTEDQRPLGAGIIQKIRPIAAAHAGHLNLQQTRIGGDGRNRKLAYFGAFVGQGNGSVEGPRAERRTRYFLDLQKRLSPLVATAFPREQEIELRSGTVIVDLTISKTGGVLDVIVVRPSGFHQFDQNVLSALRSAKALEPVPDLLGSGAITIRVPVHGGWRVQ